MVSLTIIPFFHAKSKVFWKDFYKITKKVLENISAKKENLEGNMIVSAVSLWKKYNTDAHLSVNEWNLEDRGDRTYSHLHYSGHQVDDGRVRVYARFGIPKAKGKVPAVLFLTDAGETYDEKLMDYFIDKGYAVLVPDYTGEMSSDLPNVWRTSYPPSLRYGNYEKAKGLYDLEGVEAHETTWFEWTYVALYSVKYLLSRADISGVGVIGVRKGGDIAWQTMLSSDVKCGIPINAAGWRSFINVSKFGASVAHHLSDDQHRYIAAVESQSYAPYVKCPVLMLCALRDREFDCDRAYDTYSRIGTSDGSALTYSLNTGACIGPNSLHAMSLFLEKNLKGREIYLPSTLNISVTEAEGELDIRVDCDKDGILDEVGIFYAEADVKTRSTYRDWHRVYKVPGRCVKNNVAHCKVQPFKGAKAVYAYAYAKYLNGFRVTSKIVCKRMANADENAVRSHHLFSGKEMDTFGIADYENSAIGGIFLEEEAVPKTIEGYGGIIGAYSVGGIRTYKISSPRYIPEDNALLEFDAYSEQTQVLRVSIEVADMDVEEERYTCEVEINGGGKWKRIILKAADFKGEKGGYTLQNFYHGSALVFDCAGEEKEFSITNILWL